MTQFSQYLLREFGTGIQRLLEGKDLTRAQTREMFSQVLKNEQPELQQGALLAALRAKGETAEEIAGAWEAIVELDTVAARDLGGGDIVDNSGTGMDQLKTFNVSTAAAIVVASAGVRVARHGARGLSSACGTVDVLEALGIDIDCPVSVVASSVRQIGLGLFNGMSDAVHPRALGRILSQIRFGSTLNIAASLASPCRPTHGLRGVHSVKAMQQVAETMRAIGYRRALVVHGWNGDKSLGMDELSTLGESEVLELHEDGSVAQLGIVPESVGLRRARYEDIASSGNAAIEAQRMLGVLSATAHAPCQDFVCLNAGAVFYLVGRVSDIAAGVRLAREHLGLKALRQLALWTLTQASDEARAASGADTLRAVAERAGLSTMLDEAFSESALSGSASVVIAPP